MLFQHSKMLNTDFIISILEIHLIVSFVMQFLTIPGDSLNLATNPWLSRLGTVFVWASTLTYLYVIVRSVFCRINVLRTLCKILIN